MSLYSECSGYYPKFPEYSNKRICEADYHVFPVSLYSGNSGCTPYTYRPRIKNSHSKRHEDTLCLVVSIVVALNARQRRLDLHYWYKYVSLPYVHDIYNIKVNGLNKVL